MIKLIQLFFLSLLLFPSLSVNGQNNSYDRIIPNKNYAKAQEYSNAYNKVSKEDSSNLNLLIYNIDQVVQYCRKAKIDMASANKKTKEFYEPRIEKKLPIAERLKQVLIERRKTEKEIDSLENNISKLKNIDNRTKEILNKVPPADKK